MRQVAGALAQRGAALADVLAAAEAAAAAVGTAGDCFVAPCTGSSANMSRLYGSCIGSLTTVRRVVADVSHPMMMMVILMMIMTNLDTFSGVAWGGCALPGQPPSTRIAGSTMELGLGIVSGVRESTTRQ